MMYRVAQNKPDYLLMLFKFCISTSKHVSMIMYCSIKNISPSGDQCVLRRLRQRAKLSYSAILTNLLSAGLQDFFKVLNVSNAKTTVSKLLECSLDRIVHWVN